VTEATEVEAGDEGPDVSEPMDRIDRIVRNAAAADLVASFFDPTGQFAGDLTHTLPGNLRHEITLEDLYAITFLNVRVQAKGVRALLHDDSVRERAATFLRSIEPEEDIWEGTADFGEDGPATQLWSFLQELPNVGSVTASKILCRKRPRLLPIVDRVVVEQVNAPEVTYWDVFRAYLFDDSRRKTVEALRPTGLDPLVSTLRILDVAIWMTGSRSRDAKKVRDNFGVPHPLPLPGRKPEVS